MFFKKKSRPTTLNKTIAVWSPHSGGATTVAACLCEYLSRYTENRITLIDGDIYKPCIDMYTGVGLTPKGVYNKAGQGSFNLISDALVKDVFNNEIYNELTVKYSDRCTILTGNAQLADCENIWNGDKNSSYFRDTGKDSFSYYAEILKMAEDTSNITIIDVSSNIFMDSTKYYLYNSDMIITVINPNYPQMVTAKILLEHGRQHFNLTEDRILVLVNKHSNGSLSMAQVRELLKGWKVLNNVIKADPDYFDRWINKGKAGTCMEKYKAAYDELALTLGIIDKTTMADKITNILCGQEG